MDLLDVFRPGSALTARYVLGLLDFAPEGGAVWASIRASLRPASPGDPSAPPMPPPDPSTAVGRARLRRRWLGWDEQHELLAQIRDAVTAAVAKNFKPYQRPDSMRATVRVEIDLEHLADVGF